MNTRRDFLKCSALLGAAASFPVHFTLAQENHPASPERDPRFCVPYADVLAQHPKPRTISIPDVGNYKVLKGDFHIHTLFSDGRVMPSTRVQEALQNGLDCIAITDHIEYRPFLGGNSIKLVERNDDHNIAYTIAKPEADKNNLILIRGTEITKSTMPPGHFNALFIKDANPIAAAVDDWKKMLAVASDQGGFIVWNHPGWIAPKSGGLAEGVPMSFTSEHEDVRKKGHLHGIEVFNGAEHYPIVSDWCNELNLGILATSDIHPSELQQYGVQNPRRPITLILAEERTEESIREAFFAHRTIGWVADMIFGRPEWVEKLFAACVGVSIAVGLTVSGESSAVTLKNKGDILIRLQVQNKDYELKPKGEVSISYSDNGKCRVTNWFVGTDKPLEFLGEAFTNRLPHQ
jgi:predicted metal-dependent phosphoesterase TrpH